MENGICTSTKELKVSGKDLIALGCPTGSIIGDILDELLDIVLVNPEANVHENLIAEAKILIAEAVNS